MKNAMQLKAIIKNIAKEKHISAILVLQNYMLERFLERVSLSKYRNNYIIKGGFLIASMVGLDSRTTMDMDATIKGYPVSKETIKEMIEEIISVSVADGITFRFKSIGEIREGDEVILMGRDESSGEEITAEFLGELSGRFNYELTCDISKRVPRVYVD